ncbi:D-alanyl-D-alanine carboxypeptidase family protein [Bartonella sp. TP]|uniref:D-alanyl-D-alanine carboxypeptidase family protein n=1 Tax=Bartonella sp. TP TaxID=3057550 RepID=UPI0025AF34B4|nr:D-alanyl-D-alanine carboxypeptidase family protein [Bartonella sp. TP]WJW79564.1 D-alanyl-D-alanine carboxypeptidase family protein [Bartonella sp. TP]
MSDICWRKMLIRLLCWLSISSIFLPFASFAINYNKPYILVDMQSSRVVAQNRAFDRWYPASLTKLMTVYLTFKALKDGVLTKDSKITLSRYAVSQPPSCSGYPAGTVFSLDTALKIMMVKSTNDIATSIGELIGGTRANFVKLMNMQARQLAMNYTHFASANGLPNSDNYSTARDLAILACALRRDFPEYSNYFSINAIRYANSHKIMLNSNNLLGRFVGIDGMKTGFICASGYNLVASATRAGRTLIAVVLGATRLDIREETMANLLETGFQQQTINGKLLTELLPLDSYSTQAPNISQAVCSLDAWKKRSKYLNKNGLPILTSPYIAPMGTQITVAEVAPIYVPTVAVKVTQQVVTETQDAL